jgi:ubiquinone/menaquinone biosynthesis C-methylase UbiE
MSLDWDEAYRSGQYRKQWDHDVPSQEIAACAAFGIIPSNGVILDVGCGSGSDAVFLAALGYRVKALDISSAALNLVKKKATKANVTVETFHSSATKMPIEDASIDFALDRGLLHNLNDDDGKFYASEVARVLKPGAGLLLRGARIDYNGYFFPITAERIKKIFPEKSFSSGPVIPFTMLSDANENPTLTSAIVLILRK